MIFEKGFVHSDPHPGNMFVRPKKTNPKDIELVILDHGIYT
jgi:aarF domain-containing kinase